MTTPASARTTGARCGRATRALAFASALGFAALLGTAACRPARSAYVPRDETLRRLPLYFYPSADSGQPTRALVFFFGNDIGFWEAHQELATRLARQGYDVVGFDVKRFLSTLPDSPAARDSAFTADIGPIIAGSRHELGADTLPLVLGGHSIGAEIALWTAAHVPPPSTVGVLAMSPGLRSHLRVTASDVLNAGEPHDAGSFAVPAQIASASPSLRVALVRGASDKYRYADSALVAAAPRRVRLFRIPFAGHSMRKLTVAGPVIMKAMDYLVGRARALTSPPPPSTRPR